MSVRPFTTIVMRSPAQRRVVCIGELDLASVDRFREAIEESMAGEPRRVHFDCTGVEFIDSIGMRALMHTATRCRDEGVQMTIALSPSMRRLFDTVGVTCLLDVVPAELVGASVS